MAPPQLQEALNTMTEEELTAAYEALDLTGANSQESQKAQILELINKNKTNITVAAATLDILPEIEDVIGSTAVGGSRVTRSRRRKLRRTRYNQRGGVSTAVMLTFLLSIAAATSESRVNYGPSPYTTNVPYAVAGAGAPGPVKARAEEFKRLHDEYLSYGMSLPVIKKWQGC